ncbi:TrmB family transcriptional regulator [Halobacteria archaeon HArc-gm2]|nr:TrmB family transcriptional regulator [Halobacteria archaeon HArc-gm2]
MNTEAIQRGLQTIGFNSYQAQAYAALLEHGALPAIDVAKRSGVPGSRIYDVLADLEREGYVETFEREDRRYARAGEPSDVVDGLRDTSERLSAAAEDIEDGWEQATLRDHRIALFDRVDAVLDQAESLVRAAETSVDVAATPAQYYGLQEAMREARENGAVVRVSVEGLGDDAVGSEQPATAIRRRQIPGPFVALVDRTHICFAPNERAPASYGMVFNDDILAFVFHWYFQLCLWSVCEPVYRRAEAEYTYVSMEEFVRDVYPFWRAGSLVPVTVVGVDTDTGEKREVTGVLADVVYPEHDLGSDDPPTYGELASLVTLVVESDDGRHLVGGWGAVYEDVEAEQIVFHSSELVLPPSA